MEFGTITLLDEVASKKLAPAEIVTILKEISLALGELHKNEIYHLDLKP
jgi:serine/threonine protein kinase